MILARISEMEDGKERSGFGGEASKDKLVSENLVRVSVGQLQMGMFIAELDRPWLGTPFLLQGFRLGDRAQLKILEEYCQHVFVIDDKKNLVSNKVNKSNAQTRPVVLKASGERGSFLVAGVLENKGTMLNKPVSKGFPRGGVKTAIPRKISRSLTVYEEKVSAIDEHPVAREVHNKSKTVITKLLHSAQFGQLLDTGAAEEVVAAYTQSVIRNPDAMIWMSKIKHEHEYTAEHCLNVCILAIAFGRHLNFAENELKILGLCGLLHDVGKMKVPPEILDKREPLTEAEFIVMKRHTVEGYQLLSENGGKFGFPTDVALNHHERPDSKGYPAGLKGYEISEYARVIAIVDAYDAMTSDRCYSKALAPVDAQRIIYENRGTQFDEEYALQFMKAIGPYPPGTIVELRNGMVAIVLAGRRKFRHLPTIVVLRDVNKKPIMEMVVDLHLTDSGELSKEFLIKKSLRDGSYGVRLEDYKVELSAGLIDTPR